MTIWWNGKSSDDVNIVVSSYPDFNIPKRKYEVTKVPGRNGDLIYQQDAYENVIRTYEIYISAEKLKLPNAVKNITEWLMVDGYNKLEDGYDPEIYRMAYYNGDLNISNFYNKFGKATISFTCKPQKYLKSGELESTLTNGKIFYNNQMAIAKPLFTVTGSGTLNVNGTLLTLTDVTGETFLDCETEDAYQLTGSVNNKLTGDFPVLDGDSLISWTGFTSVKIIPRWWYL